MDFTSYGNPQATVYYFSGLHLGFEPKTTEFFKTKKPTVK